VEDTANVQGERWFRALVKATADLGLRLNVRLFWEYEILSPKRKWWHRRRAIGRVKRCHSDLGPWTEILVWGPENEEILTLLGRKLDGPIEISLDSLDTKPPSGLWNDGY